MRAHFIIHSTGAGPQSRGHRRQEGGRPDKDQHVPGLTSQGLSGQEGPPRTSLRLGPPTVQSRTMSLFILRFWPLKIKSTVMTGDAQQSLSSHDRHGDPSSRGETQVHLTSLARTGEIEFFLNGLLKYLYIYMYFKKKKKKLTVHSVLCFPGRFLMITPPIARGVLYLGNKELRHFKISKNPSATLSKRGARGGEGTGSRRSVSGQESQAGTRTEASTGRKQRWGRPAPAVFSPGTRAVPSPALGTSQG